MRSSIPEQKQKDVKWWPKAHDVGSTQTRNVANGQGADEPKKHDRCTTIKRTVCVHNYCMCPHCMSVQSTTSAVMCAHYCCYQHRIPGGGRTEPIHRSLRRRVFQESKAPMNTDIATSAHVTVCFQAYDKPKGSIVSNMVHSDNECMKKQSMTGAAP